MNEKLKKLRENLEKNKTISREDVAKIETIVNSNFITESIALDRFSKSRTTLYYNETKNLIDRKIEEYEQLYVSKNQYIYLTEEIVKTVEFLKNFLSIWTDNRFIEICKIISDINILKYDEDTGKYIKVSDDDLLSVHLSNPEVFEKELGVKLREFLNNPGADYVPPKELPYDDYNNKIYNVEDRARTNPNSDAMIVFFAKQHPEFNHLNFVSRYNLSIKEFKTFFVDKRYVIEQVVREQIDHLIKLNRSLYKPYMVKSYLEHQNECIAILNSVNNFREHNYTFDLIRFLIKK